MISLLSRRTNHREKRLHGLFLFFGQHMHVNSDDDYGSHFPAKPIYRFNKEGV